jgi:hypothetical protein
VSRLTVIDEELSRAPAAPREPEYYEPVGSTKDEAARRFWTGRAQPDAPEPSAVRSLDWAAEQKARLAEATALLERWQSDEPLGGIAQRKLKSDTGAFLSRAPAQPSALTDYDVSDGYKYAQPAAPEPCGKCDGCRYGTFCNPGQPAAPEPSADQDSYYRGLWQVECDRTHDATLRAESAEAQLAAVNERVRKALVYLTDREDVESTPLHAIGHAVCELSPPSPSPSAVPVEACSAPAHISRCYGGVCGWCKASAVPEERET